MAKFPQEINTDLLNLESPMVHNAKGDWSAKLTYNDLPLQIQTPWLTNVFGLSEYRNSNVRVNYSLSFELREDEPDIKEFKGFLRDLDVWFEKKFEEENIKGLYFSSIRPSKKPNQYPDTLRTKLKTRGDRFDCDFMENNQLAIFTTTNGKDKISHKDRCRMVLQLMPVWSASGRVGISWKVTSIQKQVNCQFRKFGEDPAPIQPRCMSPRKQTRENTPPYLSVNAGIAKSADIKMDDGWKQLTG